MDNKTKAKKLVSELFFKEAFCVDGEAEIIPAKGFKIQGVVKLSDSKRGTFYIARVNKI